MNRKPLCLISSILLSAAGLQTVSAQNSNIKLAIPNTGSRCTTPQPKPEICGRWVCLSGDNSWEDTPLRAGTPCNKTGHCNGTDTNVCYTSSNGVVNAAYYIASVIYVPPGAVLSGGKGSSVDYGAGTVIGTTTSTTNSWKNSAQVEVSTGIDLGVVSGNVSLSFGNDFGGSTQTSIDVQATVTSDMLAQAPLPGADGINHNYDQIVLLLGPQIDVSVTLGNGVPDRIQWAMDFSKAIPQVVLVGWLNGAIPMPSAVANTLSQFGIGSTDYAQMLLADPFASDASGTSKPDSSRFALSTVLPYEPVTDQYVYKTNNNYTSSTQTTSSVNYSVKASFDGSVIGQSLKASDQFTWGNSSSAKNSTGTTDSATLTLAMPSSTYTGPTDLYVYVDTIYKTFMFSFVNPNGKQTTRYKKSK